METYRYVKGKATAYYNKIIEQNPQAEAWDFAGAYLAGYQEGYKDASNKVERLPFVFPGNGETLQELLEHVQPLDKEINNFVDSNFWDLVCVKKKQMNI